MSESKAQSAASATATNIHSIRAFARCADDDRPTIKSPRKPNQINFIQRFHKQLQMRVSHYTFEGDASERPMLKYYEYLLRTRAILHDQCGIDILGNLEKFPVDLDPSLSEYHWKIAQRIVITREVPVEPTNWAEMRQHQLCPFRV